jgi:hypothetical protein
VGRLVAAPQHGQQFCRGPQRSRAEPAV